MKYEACSIIDAPSDLGLRRTGVDGRPEALRAAGLLEGLEEAALAFMSRQVLRVPLYAHNVLLPYVFYTLHHIVFFPEKKNNNIRILFNRT